MRLGKDGIVSCDHATLGRFNFYADTFDGQKPKLLFTENETNLHRVFGAENYYPYVRDGFHEYLIRERGDAINPANLGTKVAAYYGIELAAGASVAVCLRLCAEKEAPREPFGDSFINIFKKRQAEADEFYANRLADNLSPAQRNVARQAYVGVMK